MQFDSNWIETTLLILSAVYSISHALILILSGLQFYLFAFRMFDYLTDKCL